MLGYIYRTKDKDRDKDKVEVGVGMLLRWGVRMREEG